MSAPLPADRRLCVLRSHVEGAYASSQGCLSAATCRADEVPSARPSKVISAEAAAVLIQDGWMLTPAGFVGASAPEVVLCAIRARFDATSHPRDLGLIFTASAGDSKGRGLGVLAAEGLVGRLIYGWTGTAPAFLPLVASGAVQAWNLPLGVVSHMIRDVAAGRPGPVTSVGLGTFVDPRSGGGRLNDATREQLVEVVELGGRQYLWYKVRSTCGTVCSWWRRWSSGAAVPVVQGVQYMRYKVHSTCETPCSL